MIGYLLSFFYFEKADLDQLATDAGVPNLKFFADSGAYSAATTGQPISLADYAVWLRRWQHRIDPYANLDVLFDVDASEANQLELEKLGLHPTPVWHLGEPLDLLREQTARYDFVAIGNMVTAGKRDPKLWNLLDLVHQIAADNDCGLHGFGLSTWPMIRRWPWRSVDSSSLGAAFRFGRVRLYDFYADRWLPAFKAADPAAWHQNGWLIREYGFDPAEFAGRSRKDLMVPLLRLAGATWAAADRAVPDTDIYLGDGVVGQQQEGKPRIHHYQRGVEQLVAQPTAR